MAAQWSRQEVIEVPVPFVRLIPLSSSPVAVRSELKEHSDRARSEQKPKEMQGTHQTDNQALQTLGQSVMSATTLNSAHARAPTHTRTRAHAHAHAHTSTYAHMLAYACARAHAHICAHARIRVRTRI